LIAGSLPAIIFPAFGFLTSFIQLNSYDDYVHCIDKNNVSENDDYLNHVMRTYSCWYYGYTLRMITNIVFYDYWYFIVYFMIIFKPFKWVYYISGVLMTLTLLIGYAFCITNIFLLDLSECHSSSYGRMGDLNTIVFLIVASYTLLFSHIVMCMPMLRKCSCDCRKRNIASISGTGQDFYNQSLNNNPNNQTSVLDDTTKRSMINEE
jgi:hypothetical protein